MFNRSLHKDPEAVSFQNQNKLLVEWNRKKVKKNGWFWETRWQTVREQQKSALLYMQKRGIFDSLCVLTGKCSWNISRLYISKWGLCQNDTFCQHFCESYSLLEEETKEGQQYVVVRLPSQMGSILTNNIVMGECHCILIDPDGFIGILYLARQFL